MTCSTLGCTDAVPAARVGQAYQEFDFGASPSSSDASGSLVSEVDLEVRGEE